MAKKKSDHPIHRFARVDIGVNKEYIVWKCTIPSCNTYYTPALAKGKLSLCNKCENAIILTSANMLLAKPHCDDCTVRKTTVDIEGLKDIFAKKGVG